MPIVSLSGAIGAGKDTFAQILSDRLSVRHLDAQCVRFADPIKTICHLLGVDPDTRETKEVDAIWRMTRGELTRAFQDVLVHLHSSVTEIAATAVWCHITGCYSPRARHYRFSPRKLQQWIGGAVRDVRSDYFVHHLKQECLLNTKTTYIITDSRYLNEAAVADMLVFIERPDNPCAVTTLDSSEAYLTKLKEAAHYVVDNSTRPDVNWEYSLEQQADILITNMIHRGYYDQTTVSGTTGSTMR